MFALGLLSWMYSRPYESTIDVPRAQVRRPAGAGRRQHRRVQGRLELRRDHRGLRGAVRGQAGQDAARQLPQHHRQHRARARPGRRRRAVRSCRCSSARTRSPRPSDILHELCKHKKFGVTTMQAEDEIAAIGAALGASYGGALGVTTTCGPGVALKGETISLAVALELPLVIVDVQRAGPSTGMPTKTEQADLNMALFGRHGEAPVAVVAPQLAVRLLPRRDRGGPHRADLPHAGDPALRRLRRQRLRAVAAARGRRAARPAGRVRHRARTARTASSCRTCATRRPWPGRGPCPGTPGLEHRIGGLEKADKTGDISYDPANHDFMVRTRAARIEAIEVPDLEVDDPSGEAAVLVLGWGSTYGPIGAACRALRQRGVHDRAGAPAAPVPDAEEPRRRAAPLRPGGHPGDEPGPARPRDPGAVPVDALGYNQVRGLPFTAAELETMLEEVVKNA